MLIALTVCLIPTTIGGSVTVIGIAGMDRVTQLNVLAKSGRAVSMWRCRCNDFRQDRHNHLWQSNR